MKHTQTPWRTGNIAQELRGCYIVDSYGHTIACTRLTKPDDLALAEANAEHIVKCVNSHDALVESLSEIVEHLESIADAEGMNIADHAVYKRAKEALKAAEVEI